MVEIHGGSDIFKYVEKTAHLVQYRCSNSAVLCKSSYHIIISATYPPKPIEQISGGRARAGPRTFITHRFITSRLSYHTPDKE